MDRLTGRLEDRTAYVDGIFYRETVGTSFAEKLAAYEDTGLLPEEVAQLNDRIAVVATETVNLKNAVSNLQVKYDEAMENWR